MLVIHLIGLLAAAMLQSGLSDCMAITLVDPGSSADAAVCRHTCTLYA